MLEPGIQEANQGAELARWSTESGMDVTGPLSFPLPCISALPPALPGSGNAVYELVDPNPFEWGPVGKTLNRGLRTRLLESVTGLLSFPLPLISALPLALQGSSNPVSDSFAPHPFH